MLNFRPNIGLKCQTPYYEDGLMEMRIGNLLIRNIGPTFRCEDTQVDYQNQKKNAENEPLSTLYTYRNLPTLGAAFGIYCKMEVIKDEAVYRRCFSAEQGYPPMTENGPVHIRPSDGLAYAKITIGDPIRIRRRVQKPEWYKKIKA